MTSAYEREILQIDADVSIDAAVREAYTTDFRIICNHVLNAMSAESPLFKRLCKGTSLFGSYLDNLKIDKPDEFDVHVVLDVPCGYQYDISRPGFVHLHVLGINKLMRNEFEAITKISQNGIFVSRLKLQDWLEEIMDKVFERKSNQSVPSCTGINYALNYSKCATAHNIRAVSKDRTIKIDLVPAFKFTQMPKIISKRINSLLWHIPDKHWFAVPKDMEGDNSTHDLTFSICAPQIEKFLLMDKGNMKRCLRLMKSVRDKIGKPAYGLKSYFLKTLFLYEVVKHDRTFWDKPLGELLLHMLGVLLTYLRQQNIPFFWDEGQNLLRSLERRDIQVLEKSFSTVLSKLHDFANCRTIPSSVIRALFDVPE